MRHPAATIAYPYRDGLYLNLTNRCPTACRFCIKHEWRWQYRGHDLLIGRTEPSAVQVWDAVQSQAQKKAFKELVFCGYGECTYRLPVMLHIGRKVKDEMPLVKVRLNTMGLGNLIWERDIVADLRGCLDSVSVSLNTADAKQWLEIHRPARPYRARGFSSALEFVCACARAGLKTTVTALDQPGVDLAAVRKLARELGAGFRLRPLL